MTSLFAGTMSKRSSLTRLTSMRLTPDLFSDHRLAAPFGRGIEGKFVMVYDHR